MIRFEVTVGYRTDDGLNYSGSTHSATVEVNATSKQDARLAAIDKAYRILGGYCSHVTIQQVRVKTRGIE